MGRTKEPAKLKLRANGYWYAIDSSRIDSPRSMETKDQAEASIRFAEWLRDGQEIAAAGSIPQVATILDLYFEQWTKRKVLDVDRDDGCKRLLQAFFRDRPIDQVDTALLTKYMEARYAGGIHDGDQVIGKKAGSSTVRRELSYLNSASKFMVEKVEPISIRMAPWLRPAISTILPNQAPAKSVIITATVMRQMLDRSLVRVKGQKKDGRLSRLSRFLFVGFLTGPRKRVIECLTWPQIDLEGRRIDFQPPGKAQSSKRNPIVPIPDELMPILQRAYEERISDKWFMDHHGSIRTSFENFMSRWGIEDVTAHTLRHSFMTRKALAGVSMTEIAALTGDDEATVRENYVHLLPDHLRHAANAPDNIDNFNWQISGQSMSVRKNAKRLPSVNPGQH